MKLVREYEVEGCWSSKDSKTKCRYCGTKLQLVPKNKHYNSRYWVLQINDGLLPYCCPSGCSLEAANGYDELGNPIKYEIT